MQFKIIHSHLDGDAWRSLKSKGWYRYKHMDRFHYLYLACDLDTQAWVVYYGKRV